MIHLKGQTESDFDRAVEMVQWCECLYMEETETHELAVFEPEAQVAAVLAEASLAVGSSGFCAAMAALRRAEWVLQQKRKALQAAGQNPDDSLVAAHIVLDNQFAAHHRGLGQSSAAIRYLHRATTAELGVFRSGQDSTRQPFWGRQCRLLSQTRANLAASLSEAGRHGEALNHALHAVSFATFGLEGPKAAACALYPDENQEVLDVMKSPPPLPPGILEELREVLVVALHAVRTEGEFLELERTSAAACKAAEALGQGLPHGHPLLSVIDQGATSGGSECEETAIVAEASTSSSSDIKHQRITPRRRARLQGMLRRSRAGTLDRYELTAMQGFRRLEFVLLSRFGSMSSAFTAFDKSGRGALSAQEWLAGISCLKVTKDIPLPLAKICYSYIQRYSSCPEAGITEDDVRSFSKFQDQCWQWLPSHAHSFCTVVDQLLRAIRTAISENFKNVREAFEAMDWNGDHVVSREEFAAALTSLKISKISEQDINFLFDALDQAGSGRLTFKELEFFFQKQAMDDTHRFEIPPRAVKILSPFKYRLLLRFPCISRAFEAMDINGDGMLNEEEFHRALQRWDTPADEITELWHALDYTCVGAVGLHDFQRLLHRCECGPCGIGNALRLPSPLRKRCSEMKVHEAIDSDGWRFDPLSSRSELAAEWEARAAVTELESDELTADAMGKRRVPCETWAKSLPRNSSKKLVLPPRLSSEGSTATGTSSSSCSSDMASEKDERCTSPELKRGIAALQRSRRSSQALEEEVVEAPRGRLRRCTSAPRLFSARTGKNSACSAVAQLRDTVELARAAFESSDLRMQEDGPCQEGRFAQGVRFGQGSDLVIDCSGPRRAQQQNSTDLKIAKPERSEKAEIADLMGDLRTAMKQGRRPGSASRHTASARRQKSDLATAEGTNRTSGLSSFNKPLDLDKLSQSALRSRSSKANDEVPQNVKRKEDITSRNPSPDASTSTFCGAYPENQKQDEAPAASPTSPMMIPSIVDTPYLNRLRVSASTSTLRHLRGH